MRSPLETYRDQPNKDKLRKEAFSFFEKKYFTQPFTVQDDLFETNERIAAKKLRFFIPGRIYTWQYDPLYKDFLDFYDKRPIVLVHSQFVAKNGNVIVQGLNLNFLPEFQRVQTMEVFSKVFASDLRGAEESIAREEIGILRKAWQILTDWSFIVKLFNQQERIGYQWAYRNYIIERIKEPVLIELEDWSMIPFFVPREFSGKDPKQIWSEYLQVKNQLSKKKVNDAVSKANQKKYTKPGG